MSWKQPLQMGNMVIEVEDRKLLPDLRLHEVRNLEKVVWVQHQMLIRLNEEIRRERLELERVLKKKLK